MSNVMVIPAAGYVNVRQRPTTDSKIVGRIYYGDKVEVSETKNNWYRLSDGGYFYGGVVKLIPLSPVPKKVSFYSPVGTRRENVWPEGWYDATGFAVFYHATGRGAWHTGVDLNMADDQDRLQPVFASAVGVVTFAGRLKTWGNVVVIEHPSNHEGLKSWTRYAHLDEILVGKDYPVAYTTSVGTIGDAFGRYPYHLHFDVAITDCLLKNPAHWPGASQTAVIQNYVDPGIWIKENN